MADRHDRSSHWSARQTLWPRQRAALALAGVALGVLALISPTAPLVVVATCLVLLFSVTTGARVFYVVRGYRRRIAPGPGVAPLCDDQLPTYTVMVALYHEAVMAEQLLDGLAALDYPIEKLQVLLLTEADDPQTAAAMFAHRRQGQEVLVVSEGLPKTKPRALNAGLTLATGQLLTIYDAEDRPDRDQLRKAAGAFAVAPDDVVALQARLVMHNDRQNLLTQWFASEYANHFGLYLEGLAATRHPIPLGGTSTHFRTAVIRELGGWDKWNVTEDCELGMRLYAAGYRTDTLDSGTLEDACSRPSRWIKQRSRWVKGFAQTTVVMTRRPLLLCSQMGARAYIAALITVAGVPLVLCAQLVCWVLLVSYFALRYGAGVTPTLIERSYVAPVLLIGTLSLLIGNFVSVMCYWAAIYHAGRFHLMRSSILLPAYWLLMSLGAWKGVLQLINKPHYWEKTEHGADGGDDVSELPPSRVASEAWS